MPSLGKILRSLLLIDRARNRFDTATDGNPRELRNASTWLVQNLGSGYRQDMFLDAVRAEIAAIIPANAQAADLAPILALETAAKLAANLLAPFGVADTSGSNLNRVIEVFHRDLIPSARTSGQQMTVQVLTQTVALLESVRNVDLAAAAGRQATSDDAYVKQVLMSRAHRIGERL